MVIVCRSLWGLSFMIIIHPLRGQFNSPCINYSSTNVINGSSTHQSLVTHIYIYIYIYLSINEINHYWITSPVPQQAIISVNADYLSVGLLPINSEIGTKIQPFAFTKMHSKILSAMCHFIEAPVNKIVYSTSEYGSKRKMSVFMLIATKRVEFTNNRQSLKSRSFLEHCTQEILLTLPKIQVSEVVVRWVCRDSHVLIHHNHRQKIKVFG